jgi:hypothetical protein
MSLRQPTVLILGATGQTGRTIVEEFDRDLGGVRLRLASRRQAGVEALRAAGKEAVDLDLDDPPPFGLALAGVDRLFLLTGYTVAMLHQSETLVGAVRRARVSHIVHRGIFGNGDCIDTHFARDVKGPDDLKACWPTQARRWSRTTARRRWSSCGRSSTAASDLSGWCATTYTPSPAGLPPRRVGGRPRTGRRSCDSRMNNHGDTTMIRSMNSRSLLSLSAAMALVLGPAGRAPAQQPVERRVDLFANCNVTAIVLEVPSGQIGGGRVGGWASISLHGHEPQRQVARAAWPLIKRLFVRDDHAGAHFNEDPPTRDYENAGERVVANVARLTGSVADPLQYGRYVANRVLPDILPYTLGTAASFGFAGVNGRGLADPVYDVVRSIFANRAIAGSVDADPDVHRRPFPYLAPRHTEQKPFSGTGRESPT